MFCAYSHYATITFNQIVLCGAAGFIELQDENAKLTWCNTHGHESRLAECTILGRGRRARFLLLVLTVFMD
jgi:hypothetical protein